ncbi:MAG TPA: ABC transporter ATP-binding protein [Thermoanaerobaculia bacterium]|nr:ABC transporter ATP-binding protein [Thermoanaerobaculia bacterium]
MIELENVRKSLGGRVVLDGITLQIRGGVMALLGRNGSGKSTLMKILAGLWHPDSGAVRIEGHDLATNPVEAKRVFGYQPEFPDLHPSLQPRELFAFAASARKLSRGEVDAAIERFDAKELAGARAGTLSQGQRRIVTLIAATMHAPPVLLLDEPTNALDPHRIAALKTFLQSEHGPRTLFVSTHQLDFVTTIATHFALLAHGHILAAGTLDDLRAHFGEPDASLEELVVRHT